MSNLLQQGADWLAGKLEAHAGTPVEYHRGVQSVPVTAVIGRTEFVRETAAGDLERFQSRDFLIKTAELVLAGSLIEPAVGDVIHEAQNGITQLYEVAPLADAPHYRPTDPYRVMYRIHTKHIGTL